MAPSVGGFSKQMTYIYVLIYLYSSIAVVKIFSSWWGSSSYLCCWWWWWWWWCWRCVCSTPFAPRVVLVDTAASHGGIESMCPGQATLCESNPSHQPKRAVRMSVTVHATCRKCLTDFTAPPIDASNYSTLRSCERDRFTASRLDDRMYVCIPTPLPLQPENTGVVVVGSNTMSAPLPNPAPSDRERRH